MLTKWDHVTFEIDFLSVIFIQIITYINNFFKKML